MSKNILPTQKGQQCIVVCSEPGYEYAGQGVFTGKTEVWEADGVPFTVYSFLCDEEDEEIFFSADHDVIICLEM